MLKDPSRTNYEFVKITTSKNFFGKNCVFYFDKFCIGSTFLIFKAVSLILGGIDLNICSKKLKKKFESYC